jgi:hypothetical protein
MASYCAARLPFSMLQAFFFPFHLALLLYCHCCAHSERENPLSKSSSFHHRILISPNNASCRVLINIERATATDVDDLCSLLIDFAIATGTSFPIIRSFIQDEFKNNVKASGEGSIMRGNSIASKLTKAYLSKRM